MFKILSQFFYYFSYTRKIIPPSVLKAWKKKRFFFNFSIVFFRFFPQPWKNWEKFKKAHISSLRPCKRIFASMTEEIMSRGTELDVNY